MKKKMILCAHMPIMIPVLYMLVRKFNLFKNRWHLKTGVPLGIIIKNRLIGISAELSDHLLTMASLGLPRVASSVTFGKSRG